MTARALRSANKYYAQLNQGVCARAMRNWQTARRSGDAFTLAVGHN
jgi:hypothetical protein